MKILIVISFLLIHQLTFAQRLNFRQYSIESGLARSSVYALCQDDYGYLWIGLDGGGMARFDGYDFKTFDINDGLPSQHVRTVFQDSKGLIWLGTTEGLAFYDHQTIRTVPKDQGLTSNYIRSISEDDAGGIWVGTNEGINIIQGDSITLINENNGLLHNKVRVIKRDHVGRMWVGTDNGISVFHQDTITTYDVTNGLPSSTVLELFEDRAGIMWVGTKFGLAAINKNRVDIYDESDGLISSRVRAIAQDKFGNMWFGTREGVSKFNGRRFFSYTEKNGLSNDRIRDILLDDNGNLWFATFFGGINKYSGDDFITYSQKDGLTVDQVFGITGNRENEILLGTFNGVSIIRTRQSSIYSALEVENILPEQGLGGENILSAYTAPNGDYWLGTNFGVSVITESGIDNIGPVEGLAGLEVRAILPYDDTTFFIGTDKGLSKITSRNGHYTVLSSSSGNEGQQGTAVSCLIKDKSHGIWIGYRDGGISYYDADLNKNGSEILLTYIDHLEGIQNVVGMTVHENSLWIGTDGGGVSEIVGFNTSIPSDFDNKRVRNYNQHDGLSSNHIYTIIFDQNGYLWLGSEKGIDQVYIENGNIQSVHKYGKHQGVHGVEIHENSGYLDVSGNLWFGTVKGVVFFDVSRKKFARSPPKLHITDMYVFGRKLDADEANAKGYTSRFNVPINAELAYNQNSIGFRFTGIDLRSPEGIQYKWKLENFDDDWSDPSSRRSVNYTNLPPGEYRFLVKARTEDGQWSERASVLAFTIFKPFWQTAWFLAIVIILAILLIFLLSQWRVRRLHRAKVHLETQVALATKEIEKQRDVLRDYNQSVTDSINYALRIQNAIMGRKNVSGSALQKKMFVFYKPKDIVSGDFYWFAEKNDLTYIAAADCTGHGVPGAFMSMIGITYLNQILGKNEHADTDVILNALRANVIEALKNEGEVTKDGMDIALCKIDWKVGQVEFSGANNPLYIVRHKKLIETKGDKMPIGEHDREKDAFTKHVVNIQTGDMLYIFSDGFADQFGGEKGKKYLYKRFKVLLESISENDLNEQKELLIEAFEDWRANQEQVDDILVMGVRI